MFGEQPKRELSEQELEESRRRAAEARLKRQNDPFYLPPVNSDSAKVQGNFFDTQEVSQAEEGQTSEPRKAVISAVKYTVKKDGDLPTSVPDDEQDVKNPKDLSSVDLNINIRSLEGNSKESKSLGAKAIDSEISEEILATLWNEKKFLCGDNIVRSVCFIFFFVLCLI
jgi:hypothetical protein